jgi:glutamate-1-semialdehyde 2,1-aminomutase
MIGGGFPIGAIVGRADVMDVLDPRAERVRYPLSGTFSANPISTTAGLAAMRKFDEAAVARLNELTARAVRGIEDAIESTRIAACVTGGGSMFRIHMKEQAPRDYREAFPTPDERARLRRLLDHLFDSGFVMINTCSAALSTAMTEVEVDALVAACASGFERLGSA